MEHKQPRTPIQTNNLTAEGFINNKVQQKQLKSMDMRFHWLKCREAQKQFRFYWRPGKQNLADYWTKHHPVSHHQNMRAEFLTKLEDLKELCEHAHHVGTQDASCKGVIDNIRMTYRRKMDSQLESLLALQREFKTRTTNCTK